MFKRDIGLVFRHLTAYGIQLVANKFTSSKFRCEIGKAGIVFLYQPYPYLRLNQSPAIANDGYAHDLQRLHWYQ